MHKIYLASKSPRRKEIIANAGFEYELVSIEVEEDYPEDMPVEDVAEFLAYKKAKAHQKIPTDGILLTSDTVVILDGKILGKPENRADATKMLKQLSGRTHTVITGVCLLGTNKKVTFSDFSEVLFADLTDAEIAKYVDSPLPYDKAGSYGIQSGLGMVAVQKIVGSYFNIMGLPIHRVYEAIKLW